MTEAYYVLVDSNTSHTSLMLSLHEKWSNWQKQKKKGVGVLGYLSSLTFLMLSVFNEIVNVIFLPTNSLWSGATQGTLLSGHFSCASGSLASMHYRFYCCCCYAVVIMVLIHFILSVTILIQMPGCLPQS